MSESPTEYGRRTLKYAWDSKQPLSINDPNLNRLEKTDKAVVTEQKENWYDKMAREKCAETGVFYEAPKLVVTETTPKTQAQVIDEMFRKAEKGKDWRK